MPRLLSAPNIVRDICDGARTASCEEGQPPTLLGQAAYALLLHYATRAGIGDYGAGVDECLERACAGLAEGTLGATLRRGFPGIAWVVQHVSGAPAADDDALEEIDALLVEHVARTPWDGDPEELAGIAVYALERLPTVAARRMLEHVVARLAETADRIGGGAAWRTSPRLYAADAGAPTKVVHSLGVAHGAPSVLIALAGAAAHGVDGARALFQEGARWLWQQADRAAPIRFDSWLDDGVPAGRRSPSWCTGDVGVAGAMLAAARLIGSRTDESRALELALHAATWTPERVRGMSRAELTRAFGRADMVEAFRGNPFFCHGAAGRSHIFARLHRATDDTRFAMASRDWFKELLALAKPGQRFGGYGGASDEPLGPTEGSLVYGAIGVGLVLLAATTPIEPAWDRLLMLSIAP